MAMVLMCDFRLSMPLALSIEPWVFLGAPLLEGAPLLLLMLLLNFRIRFFLFSSLSILIFIRKFTRRSRN